MNEIIKKLVFFFLLLLIASGSAWGGWFSFEPNLMLLDGTAVARYLDDIEQQNAYLKKGDSEHANQLISDEKVYIIKKGRDMTRVKYVSYEENGGSIFIQVQDESGTKIWANMKGVACLDQDGKEKNVTKKEVIKGNFRPLP